MQAINAAKVLADCVKADLRSVGGSVRAARCAPWLKHENEECRICEVAGVEATNVTNPHVHAGSRTKSRNRSYYCTVEVGVSKDEAVVHIEPETNGVVPK